MNKDKFDRILGLVELGALALTLVVQDWQIRDLNARVRRLETRENIRSVIEMADSFNARKKED